MPELFAIFPLKLVVFPGEYLNLHIFEPRYRQLIKDCDVEKKLFGIPSYFEKQKLEYGTIMRLEKIQRTYPDGRMDIKTLGISVFVISKYYSEMDEKLYPGALVKHLPNDLKGDIILYQKILDKIRDLYHYMNIKKPVPVLDNDFNMYKLAHHVGLSIEQEYEFLKINKEIDRQEYILDHLIKLIPIVKEMEAMRKKVQMNGHFKNIIPPKIN